MADRNLYRVSDLCLSVLRLNVGFRQVFKPVKPNLVSIYSDNPGLVDCFRSLQSYFYLPTFLNLPNKISGSD